MNEDRRQRLRTGVPGYGVEPPYAEGGAVPPAHQDDRPTAGFAPPGGRSTEYIPAHGHHQAGDDPERGHGGGGWFAGEDAGYDSYRSRDAGGYTDGGYGGREASGYGGDGRAEAGAYRGAEAGGYRGAGPGPGPVAWEAGGHDEAGQSDHDEAYGVDDGPVRPSDPYAALADLAPRPSGGHEGDGLRSFQPTHRGDSALDDAASAGVSHGFPQFQPARPGHSSLDESAPGAADQYGYAAPAGGELASRGAGEYGYTAPAGGELASRGAGQYGYAAPGEEVPASRGAGPSAPVDGGVYSGRRAIAGGGETAGSSAGVIELSGRRSATVRQEGHGHRRRALVLLAAVLGVTMAVSVGYLVLRPGSSDDPTAGGVATAPVAPDEAPVTDPGELPASVDPATSAPTSPAAATTSATGQSTGNTGNGGTGTGSGTGSGGSGSGNGATTAPRPTATPAPTATATASPPAAVPTPTSTSAVPPAPLTAVFDQQSRPGQGGFVGVTGRVRVSNPRDTEVTAWTVRLTIPGGGPVTVSSGAVSVTQDGEAATFRPAGALAANASVTFTFEVAGQLPALPSGCTVDGNACS